MTILSEYTARFYQKGITQEIKLHEAGNEERRKSEGVHDSEIMKWLKIDSE